MPRRAPLVLEVDLSREVVERAPGLSLFRPDTAVLRDIEQALGRARGDSRVSGLLLRIDSPEIGWSKVESLFRAIRGFAGTGKPTTAVLAGAGNAAYVVACACERIVLDPSSTLDLQSLASESFFFKDVLGELGIEPELDQVGEFKSSGEMFTRSGSSEAHRIQTDAILSDLHRQMVARVAEGRSLPEDVVAESWTLGPFLPTEALARRLVDAIADGDEARELLEERLGGKVRVVSQRRYLSRGRLLRRLWQWRRPRIAVVHAVGVITSGGGSHVLRGPRAIGARALGELLAAVRAHRRVKAVVLRVESPGGGAVASDRIRREVESTAKVKPIVVSMGDVAASGGYYLATAASSVVAESSTLTGSIGVLGGKFVVARLLDRLGIRRETRVTGPNATFFSPFSPYRDEERVRHRELLRYFYEKKFLPAVAEGRRLGVEEADRLGRGRVWTGRQAQEHGLVDRLGSLPEAIDLACELAGVPRKRARVVFYASTPRWRALLPLGALELSAAGPGYLGDLLWLGRDLAREEALFLMPRFFQIR